jgi:hypothetical protein
VEWGKRGRKGRGKSSEKKKKAGRWTGEGARSREGGRVCGGTQKREKLSRVDYISSSIHSSGPPLHPGSLAVNQHLGPDHRHSPFTVHRRHPVLSPPSPPSLSLFHPSSFFMRARTSAPPHHPNFLLPRITAPLFPFSLPTACLVLFTLIETLNAAPLRRGLPLIVSVPPLNQTLAYNN